MNPSEPSVPGRSVLRSAAYLSAYAVSRVVPKWAGVLIADAASFSAHHLKRKERQGVRRNLAAALGSEPDSRRVKTAARGVYRKFGRSCVELLYETKRVRGPVLPDLEVRGADIFERALSEKRGVVLAAAHSGAWELGALALASRGYPLTALAHPPAAGAAGLYERHRERAGLRALPASGGAFRCLSVLRSGGALGIVVDRRFGAPGIQTEFFGRVTLMPQGAARLAVCAGSPVIGAALRLGAGSGGRPLLKFFERLDPAPPEKADAVPALQGELAGLLERMISEAPDEWYCFEDLWAPVNGMSDVAYPPPKVFV
jgi:lauroyl/myristoyl acyltransferase